MKRWASISLTGLGLVLVLGLAQVSVPRAASADEGPMKQEKDAAQQVLPGNYWAKGTSGGNVYEGRVTIKRVGQTYVLTWTIGKETYSGVGIVEGNILSVSCIMAGKPCVVVYKIKAGGVLDGRWSMIPGSIEHEILTLNADLA